MGLPTVLVNQFAKTTNDKKDELKIETLYGKAKIVDGKQYVQLDGSDLLTPCTSTVTLKNDDRVIVSVGRHEAVVTGNLTVPAINEDGVTDVVTGVVEKQVGETVNQSLDAYDEKLKQMNDLAANTMGFYHTEEKDENGATVTYQHDKPTLGDSTIIYKMGIDGFFLSTDGGLTWTAGFDSNGDAVLNIVYAKGIQSKWVNTRGLTATDNEGNETFRIDEETGSVYIDPKVFMLGDTDIAETINQAVENSSNIVMLLTSESQSVTTDENGNIIEGYDCSTTVTVMSGSKDITSQCSIGVTAVSGLSTYTWDPDTKTLDVEAISQDNCFAEITAIYKDVTVSRRFNVVKYASGVNGKTSYFHIKYSSVPNPTTADEISEVPDVYIGTYVDFEATDSTDPSKYTWCRFAGIPGEQGIPGINGEDGKTSYLHIAYADSADGKTGFSITDATNKEYIGQYTDFVKEDSTEPTRYTWSRIKGDQGLQGLQGEKGEQGIPGQNGADGRSSYFHIKYSSVANPTSSSQISEVPSTYIGTYVDFEETDSTDPSKYKWTRFAGLKGDQGIPGTNGTDGKTSYLHIAYANSADGLTGFSISDSTDKKYIGQYTDFTIADSKDPSKYTWSRLKGDQGIQGIQGEQGEQGVPGQDGKGISSITVYYATNNSTTAPTSGWSTTFKAPSESAKYLWTYQVTTFTDGSTETTSPHVIGTFGKALTASEIWELLLTQHKDFIYKGSDGNIYIKATYIDTGNLCGWTANRATKTFYASSSGTSESDNDNPSMIDLNNPGGSVTLDASKALVQTEPDVTTYNRFPYARLYGDKVAAREARFNRLFVKTSADSEYAYNIKMGHNTNGSYVASPAIYQYPALSSSALPVYINSNGTMSASKSSSKRFKRDLNENPDLNYDAMYEIPIYEYKYNEGYFEDPNDDEKIFVGLLAEDIASVDERLVIYDEDGQVRMWDEQQLIPFLLGMIQKDHKEIKELKDELARINERLSALENK